MGCGIAGFLGLDDKALLKRMVDALRHRGPDEQGTFIDDGVGLGSARLSIIDLTHGSQPIHNEDGSIWVVHNGEIYNYLELKEELEKFGHKFYTNSDTEVIVHSYEEWASKSVEKLRGMFAFALWDSSKHILFLVRDRFGKKPLFYMFLDDSFFFASEMKSFFENPDVKRSIDFEALDHYFTYLYVPSPKTIFRGIYKLPPAHYMMVSKNDVSIQKYWDLNFKTNSYDESTAIEMIYKELCEAVRVRLRSDVPLGAFLSGGIDSSTITSIMSKYSEEPVKTVSVAFEDPDKELKYARTMAELLGTDHHEFLVKPEAYKVLHKLIYHFDEPFADPSMMPTFYLSEVTRKEVKVALSGDGGDEMFIGYPFFTDPNIYGAYKVVPKLVRKPLLSLITRLPIQSEFVRMAEHAREKDYGDQSPATRYVLRMTTFSQEAIVKLYSEYVKKFHQICNTQAYLLNFIHKFPDDLLHAMDYATIKGYLCEDILVKVDRMSMAVSLEVRCPLLDHLFAEFVQTIPSSMKFNGKEMKYIFKKMVVNKGLIPKEVAYRKKVGFGPPVDKWLGKEWKSLTDQLFDNFRLNGMFDEKYLRDLQKHRYANSGKIFGLTVFMLWYKMYIEEEGPTKLKKDIYAYV